MSGQKISLPRLTAFVVLLLLPFLLIGTGSIRQQHSAAAAGPFDETPIVSPDVAEGDTYGNSVAIEGNTLVVGAQWTNAGGKEKSGAAYVFTRPSPTSHQWTQLARLVADDGQAFDQFGSAAAVDGDTIAVGAVLADISGNTDQGAVYLFERNQGGTNNWGQVKKLTIPTGDNFEGFGDALAMQGDEVFVGAKDADVNGSKRRGAVFVYRRDDGWSQPATLMDPSGRESDSFGAAIAVDGNWLAVGAERADVTGTYENDGAVLLFKRTGPGAPWEFFKRLSASDADGSDRFGAAVALSNGRVLAGAPAAEGDDGFSVGKAYLFEQNQGGADNWGEVAKLVAADGLAFDGLGVSAALSATTAFVGSYAADAGLVDVGAVYLFEPAGGVWSGAGRITAGDGATGDRFAEVLAMDGDTLLAGAPAAGTAGKAYVFTPGTPPQPSVTYLPMIFNPGFTIIGDLVNGGVVVSPEGVHLGAVAGALDDKLPVGVAKTARPPEPLGPPVTPLGDAYRLNAGREMIQDMDKAFVLGLPIPNGADTDHLAIAALGSTADLLDTDAGQELYWRLAPGIVDEKNGLLLAVWPYLSPEGETVIVVEHPDMKSPLQGTSHKAAAGADAFSGNFTTACAPNFSCKEETLQAFANQLQKDYADFYFNFSYFSPRLSGPGSNLSVDPPILSSDGSYYGFIYDRTKEGCIDKNKDPAYGGQYSPSTGQLHICLGPNADLDDGMRDIIRHEVFHAFQHGYSAVMDDANAGTNEDWIIEGSATTVMKSGQNWARVEQSNIPIRAIDKSLRFTEEGKTWEYQAQDFWVYFGSHKSSSGIDWFKRVFAAGATYEDVAAAMNFNDSYWEWARNQVIDHNDTFDGWLAPKCVLEEAAISSMVEFDVNTVNTKRLTGSTGKLNSTVVELKFGDDWFGLPATIAVRMLPDGTPQPEWFNWKVYRLPYPECASFPSNIPQEYDEISPNLRYFVVLGNSGVEGDQQWEIMLE